MDDKNIVKFDFITSDGSTSLIARIIDGKYWFQWISVVRMYAFSEDDVLSHGHRGNMDRSVEYIYDMFDTKWLKLIRENNKNTKYISRSALGFFVCSLQTKRGQELRSFVFDDVFESVASTGMYITEKANPLIALERMVTILKNQDDHLNNHDEHLKIHDSDLLEIKDVIGAIAVRPGMSTVAERMVIYGKNPYGNVLCVGKTTDSSVVGQWITYWMRIKGFDLPPKVNRGATPVRQYPIEIIDSCIKRIFDKKSQGCIISLPSWTRLKTA